MEGGKLKKVLDPSTLPCPSLYSPSNATKMDPELRKATGCSAQLPSIPTFLQFTDLPYNVVLTAPQ